MSVNFDRSAGVTQQQVSEIPATSPRGVPALSTLSSISPSTAAPGGVSSVGMGYPQLASAAARAPSVESHAAGPLAPSDERESIDRELEDALRLIEQLEFDEAYARDLEYRQATGQAPLDDVDPDVTEAYAQRNAAETVAHEAFADRLASEGPILPEHCLFDPAIGAVTRGQLEENPRISPRDVPGLSTLSPISPSRAAPGGVSSVARGYPQLAPAASSAPSLESQAEGLDLSDDDAELQRALLGISQLEADQALQSREDGGRASSDDVLPNHLRAYEDALFAAELHDAHTEADREAAEQLAADRELAIELDRQAIPIPQECLEDEALAQFAQIKADEELALRLQREGGLLPR